MHDGHHGMVLPAQAVALPQLDRVVWFCSSKEM
jgi:hypothetical protein